MTQNGRTRGGTFHGKMDRCRESQGLVEDGGILVQASCSSRVTTTDFFDTVTEAAEEHGATFTELRRTGHDVDHPVTFDEGEYLKAGYWRVEPGYRSRRS